MNPYLLVTDSLILLRRVYSESSRKNSCVVRTCQLHSQLVRPFDPTQRPSRHHLGREAGWKEVLYQTGESKSNEWNQFFSHRVVHSLDKELPQKVLAAYVASLPAKLGNPAGCASPASSCGKASAFKPRLLWRRGGYQQPTTPYKEDFARWLPEQNKRSLKNRAK